MVSLVIIAVITVILYPTISDLAPNNNKFLFKSTYKTIENVVSEITASGNIPTSSTNTCIEFENRLNVNNEKTCQADQMFQTTNGVRWAFEYNAASYNCNGNNTPECYNRIWVDVNASNNKIASNICNAANPAPPTNPPGPAFQSWEQVGNPPSNAGIFYCNNPVNTTTQDTFYIDIRDDGKIIVTDPAALSHLQDND